MNKKLLLSFFLLILFIFDYSFLDNLLETYFLYQDSCFVEKVIDGDTIICNNQTIRLLGINAPEKNEGYFFEAKNFLSSRIKNKKVYLKFSKQYYDKYHRILAYIFLNNTNINREIVKHGLANPYFPQGNDFFTESFFNAWVECIDENVNLCKESKDRCSECIILKEFSFSQQKVTLFNKCNFSCDLTGWILKEEGRKKFVFPNFTLKPFEDVSIVVSGNCAQNCFIWNSKAPVWTETGDTLFLRDRFNDLVLWKRVGYNS